jgi:O-antigen/teichoic acid export membrane protein
MKSSQVSNKIIRGTVALSLGQVAGFGLSFARNIILARMLSKADFGLAAVFGMSISLLEVAGRMSFGQQNIQSKDGDSIPFQATSHTFQFILSFVSACLILCLSHPMALVFKVPEAAWAFAMLALVPLARGLEHLDYYRQQRELDYLPAVMCEVVPQAVMTVAVWPMTVWLGDFRVIIWLMLGKAVLGIVMSHWLARRPYRWAWHADFVKGMWSFGWPLLLTGLLIFGSQQADQVVVGAFLSLNNLATYALALSLVSMPWLIFGQVGSSLMLPVLSRVQEDPAQFRSRYRTCVECASVGAVALTLPLIVFGEQIVTLFYGGKYAGSGTVMAILGAASAVRFLRFVPAVASMARADTLNQLYANIWRSLSLPLAALVAMLGGGMAMVAVCALGAELVSTGFTALRLRRRQGVPLQDTMRGAAFVLGFVFAGLGTVYLGAPSWGVWIAAGGALLLPAFAALVAWLSFPGLAHSLLKSAGWTPSVRVQQPVSVSLP